MTDNDPADERAAAFVASLEGVPRESTTHNDTALRVGVALQAIGAAMALFGLLRSQLTNNPLDQFTAISLGLAGLALVLIGLGLYVRHSLVQFLRFWMLRMSYEQAQR